jgi:hypothetical protein
MLKHVREIFYELAGLKHAVKWWRTCEALALNN